MSDTPTAKTAEEEKEKPHEEEPEEWQIQRDNHKTAADAAFRGGAFRTAIDEYTKAISLDPDGFVVLYSNRSAAYLANSEISKALVDAHKCVALDATFVKGYSRLAAALFSLKRFDQAKDAYQEVLNRDKGNTAAKKGLDACEKEIERRRREQQQTLEEEERQRLEMGKKDDAQGKKTSDEEAKSAGDKAVAAAGDDEEDDLLNDFFEEVEEVVSKKKEEAAAVTQPASNNAIRNDRQTLGTTQEQVERLLQPHFEWRNLNPYWVLQLPAANATDDDISRRYKALSLLLHPDKNQTSLSSEKERDRIQLAYDQVQKAKTVLADVDRKRYTQSLVAEGMKQGERIWAKQQREKKASAGNKKDDSLKAVQEREVMRLFAQVEQKRRDVEARERKYEQREQQKEDDDLEKERKSRQFDKSWRKEERVDKRVGNWRDFSTKKKAKK